MSEPINGKTGPSSVERVYKTLREQAIRFEIRPGDRINEVELARQLGVSRTPLREALNRLTSDGFLSIVPGKGFFGRRLDVKEVFDLYEMRLKLEVALAELAVDRADPNAIDSIRAFLDVSAVEDASRTIDELVDLDESFHEQVAALSGNALMLQTLRSVNARMRFVRWINMENGRRVGTQAEHRAILEAIAAKDRIEASRLLHIHIDGRLEQIQQALRDGLAKLYLVS